MEFKGSACVLVLLMLSGIGGEQLDIGDSSILTNNDINSPNDVQQIVDWKEQCRTNVGQDAVNDIEESTKNLSKCIGKYIKWSKLQHEINVSIPQGDLDLVFKKYCGRRDPLMACIEDVFTKIERCLSEQKRNELNITRRAIDAGIDFVCHNDGDRIALFMAEDGEECIKSQKENISSCIVEKVPEVEDAKEDPLSIKIEDLNIGEENCKKVNAMHQCIVKYTEKCSDPTPSNILDSLIKQVLRVTPCWQTSSAPVQQGKGMSPTQYLLPHLLTLITAALTAANILL